MKLRIVFVILCLSFTLTAMGCKKEAATGHEGHGHAAGQPCGAAPANAPTGHEGHGQAADATCGSGDAACATCPSAASCGTASKVVSAAEEARATKTQSGLKYIIQAEGTGERPRLGQTVAVHYTGYLTNGTKFDSSHDRGQPIEFPLGRGRVIKGWDEGIASMRVGEKRRLIIPAHLGYGSRGAGNAIPPNATLIFDTELVALK